MNRGIFLSRPDLSLEDLEKTAEIIFKSYIINENLYSIHNKEYLFKLMKNLARAYYVYKFNLSKTTFTDFHGTRDFYSLIKQISEKINEKRFENKADLIQIVKQGIQRNFQGLKLKNISFKDIFVEIQGESEFTNSFKEEICSLELIKSNLKEANSRYLMLITKGDSASFILDRFFKSFLSEIANFIGSQFDDDLVKEENNFRILSDIILYMEKGWTITLQDMDSVYGSLYDMFNQNFTLIGGTKKNCRIALGSVTNPMCYIKDNFRCVIILKEEEIKKCEPPFLNRFEKFLLNFETISNNFHLKLVKTLNDWLQMVLFDQYEKIYKDKKALPLNNFILNYNQEDTIASLVFYYENTFDHELDKNKEEFIVENSKFSLIKVFSNFALLLISQSENLDQKEFCETYRNLFAESESLNKYLKGSFKENDSFKSVVYTFDNVHKSLKLDLKVEYTEIKIGNFKSEITLTQVLIEFFKSETSRLLLVRFKWKEDHKHLKLVKFLIDKFENSSKNQCKSICFLIHIDFYENFEQNSSSISFLSGWDQLMLDNLDNKFLNLTNLITKTTGQVLTSEKVFTINEVFGDLLQNSLIKINYNQIYSLSGDNSAELLQKYKNILTNSFGDKSDLIELIKRKLLSHYETFSSKDWRLEILANENLLKYGYDINFLLKNLLQEEISMEFFKIFYSLEKYFPFESFFSFDQSKDCYLIMREIFYEIIQEHFESSNLSDLKVLNANQSNRIDAVLGLKFPFILKEIEILDNIIEKDEENLENLLKQIEKTSIYNKYSRFINQEDYLCDLYLQDLIRIKFNHLVKQNNEFNSLLFYLIKVLNNFKHEMASLYLTVLKSRDFLEKLYDYLKLFKNLIKIESLLAYLKQIKLKPYLPVSDQLFSHIFTYSTQFLYCLAEPDGLCYSINELASLFENLFIESISIESLRDKYYFFYFMSQFFKRFSPFYLRNELKFKRLLLHLLKIISNQLPNDEFLKDVETITEIVRFIDHEVYLPDSDWSSVQKVKIKFEFFVYSLSIELAPDNEDVMSLIFDQRPLDKKPIELIFPILQKFFYNLNLDLSLNFLTYSAKYTLLEKLNEEIRKYGLESDLSIILIEIFRNHLLESRNLCSKNFDEKLIQNLFDILSHYEYGTETEFTRNIKLKYLAYLASIAFLKEIFAFYYKDILEGKDLACYKSVSKCLASSQLSCLNSFRILILRGLNESVSSYAELRDLVLCNQNLEWNKYLKFGDIHKKFEVYLTSDGLFKKILSFGKNLDSKNLCDETSRKFLSSFLTNNQIISEKDLLCFYLALFNNFYVLNSNSEFLESKSKLQFAQNIFRLLANASNGKPRSLNQNFVQTVVKNFPSCNFLKIDSTSHIEDLKVISLIYHSFSIVLAYSRNNNPITGLFFKNGDKPAENLSQSWMCSKDNEEFTLLHRLSSLSDFVSDVQLNNLRFNPKKDYALYKCSNECNFYYIVGDCTLTGENDKLKCPKGHLLMGPKQHSLYERDGHRRIPNPGEFIPKRLKELSFLSPMGYSKSPTEFTELDYTVRDLKPLTYRILDFVLHSCLFMLKQCDFYTDQELRTLLSYHEPECLNIYLIKKIVCDYRMIGRMLETNQSYLFIHSVLAKLPDLMEFIMFKNVQNRIDFDIRNKFEMAFQEKLVNPLEKTLNHTINAYKNSFMIKDEIDEVGLLINNEFITPDLRENYPFLKLMKFNKIKNDLKHFEKVFYMSLSNKENYPLIDLYLKNKENLQILEILTTYLEVLNYLLNKFDHNITRKEARGRNLGVCFESEEIKAKFEDLKLFWNKYLRVELNDGCKIFEPVELSDQSPLSLLLCDNKLELGSGIHAKLVLKHLGSYQNSFIEQCLQIDTNKLPYLISFDRELLDINLVQDKHLINVKDFQADFFVRFYSLLIPDTMQIEYDLEKFQLFLIKTLINGKRLINISDKAIRCIQYSGELLCDNVLFISNLRETVQQELIDQNKLDEISKFMEQLKENKENNGYSILRNIFKSLEILICYLNTTKKNAVNNNLKFKDFFKDKNLKNISDFVKNLEPISSLAIKNLIQIYELFEYEMFYLNLNQFEEKYRKNLSKENQKEFEEFLKKCDGVLLPDKGQLRDALIKFSMRCLFADINETDSLVVYLADRLDVWPVDFMLTKLDMLNDLFPKSILVMHTLGNVIEVLNKSIEINDPKSKNETVSLKSESNEKIGRPNLVSSKEKQDNKTKKIFII